MSNVSELVRNVLQYKYVRAKHTNVNQCEINNFAISNITTNALHIGDLT